MTARGDRSYIVRMILDHIGISVTDFARSIAFFERALAPLGITLLARMDQYSVAGFGAGDKPEFWIAAGKQSTDQVHVAVKTSSRAVVRAFYEAAIAAGGTDNGPPGPRPMYHENYYGAFVRCPDGHNIEAVCHEAYLG